MTFRSRLASRPAAMLLGVWIAFGVACGGSGGSSDTATTTVGPAGGTVSLGGGPTLQVPAGALAASTDISIRATGQTSASGGRIYQFSPEGTTFAQPASVQMPVPSGVANPRIYWTVAGSTTQYEALATTVSGSTASAQVSHFSLAYVGPAPQVATPTFSPPAGTYATAQSVTIATTTAGATIYYTTDGTDPTTSSTVYSAPVAVSASGTLKAMATATGLTTSGIATAAYVIGGTTPQAATPTFSPVAGTYATAQSVTIASTTPGAVIHYTVDGSNPTTSSTTYTTPVSVAATTTLKAIATATGYTASAVATAAYVIGGTTPQAATPTFSPGSGTYATTQLVTISSTTPGAVIHYTTSGTDPTTASPVYSTQVSVGASGTLKAIATAPGYTTSAIGSATYTIGSGGGSTDFTTLCQGSLTEARNLLVTCLHANPDYVTAFVTSGAFDCTTLAKEIAAGRVVYNATQATACAAAIGSATCAVFDTPTPAACATVLTGQVANGGSCYLDEDCSTGWCNSTASLCPGTCQAFAQLNQSCASVSCAPGLACDSANTCKAESAANGTCPCQAGLWCDSSAASPGTCKAPQTSGTCKPANSGQCGVGYACVGAAGSETCQSLVGLGGDCTAGAALCGLGYSCDAGTHKCVSYPKVGETCGSSSPICIGGYCDVVGTQKCVAYKKIGDACTYPIDILACEPGSTCDQATSKCKASASLTCQAP
jgi:hypothetical protein